MKIDGKIKINGFLRICDLHSGESFAFEDDSENLFMTTDSDLIIQLESGEVFANYEYQDKPIKRIKAKIVIEG